jgi:hypothetical protein
MTRDEARKFFLKGYERGLRDVIAEVLRMTSRGYGGTELSVVLRSKAIDKAVEAIDRRIESGEVDLGLEAPTLGHLRGRGSYLVREAKGEKVFALLAEITAKGARPLCISRAHPDDLAAFGLESADGVWLSRQSAKGVRTASPTDLVGLTSAIHRHLEGGTAVLVVEGLEYLVSQNGFPSILRFAQTIHEKVVLKDSYLLMSANPEAFRDADYRQLAQSVTAEL